MEKSGSSNRRRTEEEVRQIIAEWESSGKNKKTFCAENNLNYMTFIGWTCKGKTKAKKKNFGQENFIPLTVTDTQEVFAEVFLKNGSRVMLHRPVDVLFLRRLMK